jgi:hypothetical protein
MHPLCLTIIRRPDLVVDHLSAYAALLTQEAGQASNSLVNRALVWLFAVMSGAIGVVLAGTALMLGILQNQFHWILLAVPGVMLLCAFGAMAWAKQVVFSGHFANIKSQFFSDAQALRIASDKEAQ